MPNPKSETRLRGIAAAPGIALGPAFIYRLGHDAVPTRHLSNGETPESESSRLDAALNTVRDDLLKLKKETPGAVGSAIAKIFDAQVMIVDDPSIRAQVNQAIAKDGLAAESAFAHVVGEAQRAIERSPDQYLREMADDIESVKTRVINRLMGHSAVGDLHLTVPSVILASTITPADIMSLRKALVLAVVTQTGGQTSHTSLLAKSLGIPAVAGLGIDLRTVRPSTSIVVDGFSGVVILNPSQQTAEFFERKKTRTHSPWPKKLEALRDLPAVTRDGHKIEIMANIDLAGETELALAAGACGIGLYRTEYLFLQRGDYPPESQQFEVYRRAVRALDGRTLVVRTFDIGSDKAAPDAIHEPNPALGVRGVRVSLEKPAALLAQFRALLAASADGPVWVMVPMISTVAEYNEVRALWSRAKKDLASKKRTYDRRSRLGLMIETPAAVIMAPELARLAQFFSVGTNDLVQYTTAVDRGNAKLRAMQHYWHPALWRQLADVVKAGHRAKIPVGICGEMSGDPLTVLPLTGLGFDSLSFHPNSIPRIKSLIRNSSYAESRRAAKDILAASTEADVRKLGTTYYKRVSKSPQRTAVRKNRKGRKAV